MMKQLLVELVEDDANLAFIEKSSNFAPRIKKLKNENKIVIFGRLAKYCYFASYNIAN